MHDVEVLFNGDVRWPELADRVATVYRDLPTAQRPTTTISTANYGEAGAIDRYGPALGLPKADGGHNGFGYLVRATT